MAKGQVICLEPTVSVPELFLILLLREREGRWTQGTGSSGLAWDRLTIKHPNLTFQAASLSISTSFFLLSHSRVTQKGTHSTQYATQPEQSWPLKLCGTALGHETWQCCHCPPAKMLWQQGTIRGRRRQEQMLPSSRCKMQLTSAILRIIQGKL